MSRASLTRLAVFNWLKEPITSQCENGCVISLCVSVCVKTAMYLLTMHDRTSKSQSPLLKNTMITHSNHGNGMTSQGSHALRGTLALFFHSFSKNKAFPFFPHHSFILEKKTGKINEMCLRWMESRPGTAQ